METIHVLIASGSGGLAVAIKELLKTPLGAHVHYHLEEATSYEDVLRCLVKSHHDVCLLDAYLDGTALRPTEVLKRANAGGCRVPVILVTTLPDEEAEEEAEDAGAAGWLNRQQDLQERVVRHAIGHAVRHFRELQDIHATLEAVQAQVVDVGKKLDRR